MAQTEALTTIQVFHGGGHAPASIAEAYNLEEGKPREQANQLSKLLAAIASGVIPAKVTTRTDSITGTRAAITLAVTQANIDPGEYLDIVVPGRGAFRITAVSSGADVTLGQFVSQTSNAITATNMAAAINGMIGLKDLVVATTNSGNLIITAKEYGSVGNTYSTVDGTVDGLSPAGGALAGGLDQSARRTAAIAITHSNVSNNDTVSIGTVVITAKTAANVEGEWTIGGNATADAAAMAAAINGHSKLKGLVSASPSSGTVTLTFLMDALSALLVALQTSDGTAFALTQVTEGVSSSSVTATRTYALGAP